MCFFDLSGGGKLKKIQNWPIALNENFFGKTTDVISTCVLASLIVEYSNTISRAEP